MRGSRRRGLRARATALALRIAVGVGIYVVAVNAIISGVGGGYPHPLSPRFMKQKTLAVGALAKHALGHAFYSHRKPPREVLSHAARRAGVAPDLLLAIARVESDLLPHRISHAGAMGMMQLMPATAAQYSVADPFDPEQAAAGAARYVAWLSRRYDRDTRRIAAAYNAGPGRVARSGPLRVGAATRIYVTRVLREAARARGQEVRSASLELDGPARQPMTMCMR